MGVKLIGGIELSAWKAYCAVIGELALYVVMTLHLAGFLVPLDFSHTTSLETHASNTYPSPGVIIHAKVMTMEMHSVIAGRFEASSAPFALVQLRQIPGPILGKIEEPIA